MYIVARIDTLFIKGVFLDFRVSALGMAADTRPVGRAAGGPARTDRGCVRRPDCGFCRFLRNREGGGRRTYRRECRRRRSFSRLGRGGVPPPDDGAPRTGKIRSSADAFQLLQYRYERTVVLCAVGIRILCRRAPHGPLREAVRSAEDAPGIVKMAENPSAPGVQNPICRSVSLSFSCFSSSSHSNHGKSCLPPSEKRV